VIRFSYDSKFGITFEQAVGKLEPVFKLVDDHMVIEMTIWANVDAFVNRKAEIGFEVMEVPYQSGDAVDDVMLKLAQILNGEIIQEPERVEVSEP